MNKKASRQSDKPIRIACVDDRTTSGEVLINRDQESYPAQLAILLGDQWDVRSFGINWDSADTKELVLDFSSQFNPHIVVINQGADNLAINDYIDLIKIFQGLSIAPKIFVCCFAKEVALLIDEVSKKTGAQVINLAEALYDNKELLANTIHPRVLRNEILAKMVYDAVNK